MINSFDRPLHDIDFSAYKPEDAVAAGEMFIKEAKGRIKTLKQLAKTHRTFENTVLEFNRSSERISQLIGLLGHLQSMDDSKWETAFNNVLSAYTTFSLGLQYDKKLYVILKDFQMAQKDLDHLQIRILGDYVRDYEDNGIALAPIIQKKVKDLSRKHIRLGVKFRSNITKVRDKHPLIIKNIKLLEGVSSKVIDIYCDEAKKLGIQGYAIPVNDGNYELIMTHCAHPQTREKFYRAYSVLPAKQNYPIMFQLLTIRYEMAKLLGYQTPAHMFMRRRMITDPLRAIKFLEDLDPPYTKRAQQEYVELLNFAQQDYAKLKDLPQYEYDTGLNLYYKSRHFESTYKTDLSLVKEYFDFDRVKNVMMNCIGTLYSLRFVNVPKQSWHKNVEVYEVYDTKSKRLRAVIYCDWFSRRHKQGHAWMNHFYTAPLGSQHHHIGVVVMNMPTPTDNEPSLLTPENVSTMWHEFGHLIHHVLTDVRYPEQDMDSIRRDFIEAPSQIMENWALHKEVLPLYAVHYKTGKGLPEKLVESIKQIEKYNIGLTSSRQHYLALLDLHLHYDIHPKSIAEMVDYSRVLRQKTLPGPIYKDFAILGTFGHIASGYISGYYTYKWSEAIQADLFSRFENGGVLNPKLGHEYRTKILARGDEADPDELIKDFLGRYFNEIALLKRDGLV